MKDRTHWAWLPRALLILGITAMLSGILFAAAPSLLDATLRSAFQTFAMARLVATKDPGCTLADVIRSERAGIFPVDPTISAAIRVIRTEADLKLADTPDGPFWIPARDLHTLAEMVTEQRDGTYDVGVYGLRPGDVVLDCGANVGVFTRHAIARGAKQVIAIDPSPEAIRCLRLNFPTEIKDGRVVIIPEGVWDGPGTLDFVIDPQSWSDHIVRSTDRNRQTIRVPLTTIDAVVSRLGLTRVDFIKMDIEGAEKQALQGAYLTISKFHPRMAIALEHFAEDLKAIPSQLQNLGMRTVCGPCVMVRPSGVHRVQPQVVMGY